MTQLIEVAIASRSQHKAVRTRTGRITIITFARIRATLAKRDGGICGTAFTFHEMEMI
jgi:hypothetical protein